MLNHKCRAPHIRRRLGWWNEVKGKKLCHEVIVIRLSKAKFPKALICSITYIIFVLLSKSCMKKISCPCSFCEQGHVCKPLTLLYSQLYIQPVSKASISAKPGAPCLSSLASLPLVNLLPWQWPARVGPWCSSKLFLSDCVAS